MSAPRRPDDGPHADGTGSASFTNDGSTVYGQYGVVNGDVTVYQTDPSQSGEQRFATALKFLDGNMPRRAETLIGEAVDKGYESNQVAYYWALAVLSGRSFENLRDPEFATLQRCRHMVDRGNADVWLQSLRVVTRLVNCLIDQERTGGLEDEELGRFMQEFDALERDRRDEIRRHLDLILTGVVQDRVDAEYAQEVRERRMEQDRANRVWLFFTPAPVAPRSATLTEPVLGPFRRGLALAGATVTGGSLLATVVLLIFGNASLDLMYVTGTAAGGLLLATFGRTWAVARERIRLDDARYGVRWVPARYSDEPPRAAADDDHTWGEDDDADREQRMKRFRRKRFVASIQRCVDALFAERNPDGANNRKKWKKDTAGLRRALAAEIEDRYAGPDTQVHALDWLIEMRAEEARERWDAGALRAHRDELRAGWPCGALTAAGVVLLLAGLSCGIIALLTVRPGIGIYLLAGVSAGMALLYCSKIDVHIVRHDVYLAESADAAEEYAREKAAFDRWTELRRNRPDDGQMARWLDYDKFQAKSLAAHTCGLANRDIVAHAILTEPAPNAKRARVLFGPPRYTAYRVIVFLLSSAGVRQVSLELDFAKGTLSDQTRTNFAYDSICSARVEEVGLRFDAGRRRIVIPAKDQLNRRREEKKTKEAAENEEERAGKKRTPEDEIDSLLLTQSFRLRLIDGQHVDVEVANFDEGFLDRLHEDVQAVSELALDNSGAMSALAVLESVAGEGGAWLMRERERRTRRLDDLSAALTDHGGRSWGDPGMPPTGTDG